VSYAFEVSATEPRWRAEDVDGFVNTLMVAARNTLTSSRR
jgi:hypothetical protein